MTVKAVTFDFWDTIAVDDSDEPKRAAKGLRPKPAERRHLLWQALDQESPIQAAAVDAAFDAQEARFRETWYGENITLPVEERLRMMLDALGRELPDPARRRLIDTYETMELDVPPDPVDGAADAIRTLSGRFKLAVVSDAIYTPGANIRRLIEGYGLGACFSGFVFSDVVGHAKPHPDAFADAARQLGTDFADMVHVGDREPKDIAGAKAMGMKAVLLTAARDEGAAKTTDADAVAASYAELLDAIESLAANGERAP